MALWYYKKSKFGRTLKAERNEIVVFIYIYLSALLCSATPHGQLSVFITFYLFVPFKSVCVFQQISWNYRSLGLFSVFSAFALWTGLG